MKKLLILISFSLCSYMCLAQKNPFSAPIMKQGQQMSDYLVARNYDGLLSFMYPKVVNSLGGKAELQKAIKYSFEANPSMEILSATIMQPLELIRVKSQMQCVVPQTMKLKLEQGTYITKSYLLAISDNGGKNWFFIDTSAGIDKLRELLGTLSNRIVIPALEKPVLVTN